MTTLRVKEPFACDLSGISYVMTEGLVVQSSHPAVKGREHLFEQADEYASRTSGTRVEQATAAPGERRSLPKMSGRKPVDSAPDPAESAKSE